MTTLVVQMSPRMARAVSKATDALALPSNQDFALKAMGLLLRSTGFAPNAGRPMGYSHRRRAANGAASRPRKRR